MEISRVNRAGVKQPAGVERKPDRRAAPSGKPLPADQVTLSKQALAYMEEQAKAAMERGQKQTDGQIGSGETSQLDGLGERMKVLSRCQKIAARIMAGDKVPPEDQQYLMENDVEGYKLAMAMRTVKKDPKEWESELEDEEKEGGSQPVSGVSSSGSSSPEPAPEVSEAAPEGETEG